MKPERSKRLQLPAYLLLCFVGSLAYETLNTEIPGQPCRYAGVVECICLFETPAGSNDTMPTLLDILTKGSELMNITFVNQATLMVGMTGVGKSTVTQIIAGNLSKLHVVGSYGGAQLVIFDEDNKIGLPSIQSKTLFPELHIKINESESTEPIAFYDFPGFEDTREADLDIAANFFMIEVTKKVANVKLVFVTTEVAFTDRESFDKLVRNAVTFMKDLNVLSRSFGMIVNRVNPFVLGYPRSDELIMNDTISSIINYKSQLGESGDELTTRKKFFIDQILEQDENGNYTRIWFVKNPIACGSVNEQSVYVAAREQASRMYENLSYANVEKNENVFGYTIKETSKTNITNYAANVSDRITASVNLVALHLIDWRVNQLSSSNNLTQLYEDLAAFQESLRAFNDSLADFSDTSADPLEFYVALKAFFISVGYPVSSKFENFMTWQDRFLSFFDLAGNIRHPRKVKEWKEPFATMIGSINEYVVWYEFLHQLEIKVFGQSFQENPKPTPPANLTNWLEFVKKEKIYDITSGIEGSASKIRKMDLDRLGPLMLFALDQSSVNCEKYGTSTSINVVGNFLRVGEFSQNIRQIMAQCNNSEVLQFFATHTIFFDEDIYLPEKHVIVLAPNWVVTKSSSLQILLNGTAGNDHSPESASPGRDATSESISGTYGANGCMGRPGGSSGSVFGIFESIESDAIINVQTNGGSGGKGQHGGKGGSGFGRSSKCYDDHNNEWDSPETCVYNSNDGILTCYHRGIRGSNGGSGGNGGRGGLGGNAGYSKFINLGEDEIEFNQGAISGAVGQPGNGGSGGIGGSAASGYSMTTLQCCTIDGTRPGTSGSGGQNGASELCRENVIPRSTNILEWLSLLVYRIRLFPKGHAATDLFMDHIDYKSNETEPIFSLQALAEESLALEKITRNQSQHRLDTMYKSLIHRLENYQNNFFNASTPEHKKVITMLLSSVFASANGVRQSLSPNLVIDVIEYLHLVISDIENWQEVADRNKINERIQAEKATFRATVLTKIEECLGFISDDLRPALKDAETATNEKLNDLKFQLEALINNEEQAFEDAKKELLEAEEQLKRYKAMKSFGSLLGIFGAFFPEFKSFQMMVNELAEKYKDSEEKVKKLKDLVSEIEKTLQELDRKQEEFENEFVPLIENLIEFFENVSVALSNGDSASQAKLMLTRWQLLDKLRIAKYALEEFSEIALDIVPIKIGFERVFDTIAVTIELYELIDQYLDVQSLADYMAALTSAAIDPITITDPMFQDLLKEFDQKLKENMVETQVQKALHAFKQWIFPFAKFYLWNDLFTFPNTGDAVERVKYLQHELIEYKTQVIANQSEFIFKQEFGNHKTGKPFYTWKQEDWSESIYRLMSGDEVRLNADVTLQDFKTYQAIKFNLAEVNVTLKKETPKEFVAEFRELKDCFGISLTHSGISYYRFNGNYFVMSGQSQNLIYSLERKPNGEPYWHNSVYGKFKSGDYMLSPFTLWTVRLIKAPSKSQEDEEPRQCDQRDNLDFSDLTKFIPYIDIELIGNGTYVDGTALEEIVGDMELDRFYTRYHRQGISDLKFE